MDKPTSFFNDPKKRAWIFQALTILTVFFIGYYLVGNTRANLEKQNIATGFDFLSREAGFEMSESVIEFSSEQTYQRALIAGVLNTLKTAFLGNFLAIFLGIIIGVSRLSNNWLLSKISQVYVESIRNIPLLLQLFFWYALFTEIFPNVRQALNPISGMFLSNRGITIAIPKEHFIHPYMLIGFFLSLVGLYFFFKFLKKKQEKFGKSMAPFFPSLLIILVPMTIIWLIGGAPTALDVPKLGGFNFAGGYTFSPEFCSLLLGLVLYTSAFIAEIVRSGILSVTKGQTEAAKSLGLKPSFILVLITLPQALRVIIPPLTSQLLNLTKNSSLAVAIAYPDFVSVANTTMNQTGQAIEMISLIILTYLSMSLATSLFMNWYNKRMALVER